MRNRDRKHWQGILPLGPLRRCAWAPLGPLLRCAGFCAIFQTEHEHQAQDDARYPVHVESRAPPPRFGDVAAQKTAYHDAKVKGALMDRHRQRSRRAMELGQERVGGRSVERLTARRCHAAEHRQADHAPAQAGEQCRSTPEDQGSGNHPLLAQHISQIASNRHEDRQREEQGRPNEAELRIAQLQFFLNRRQHHTVDGAVPLMKEERQAEQAEELPLVVSVKHDGFLRPRVKIGRAISLEYSAWKSRSR